MMNVDKNQMLNDWADKISKIVYDDVHYQIEIVFYLTQHCNLACPGCYMRGGPERPRNVLPCADLQFYVEEFKKVPNFADSVVFSGGEIFSAPIGYLEYNAHTVLDRDCQLQLKTNGAWVDNPDVCRAVIAMLRRLNPGRGLCATDADIENYIKKYPRVVRRVLGANVIRVLMYKHLPTMSMLDMAVSVDDKLHPARSADWFAQIAQKITTDKKLRNKVNLKTFTVQDSRKFFVERVLKNPNLGVTNFAYIPSNSVAAYNINGRRIESFFGDFVDVDAVPADKKLGDIVMPPIGDCWGRLVYCFYPDRTVGLDCNYLESVGRVPYIDSDGKYKSFNRIRRDIYTQLVLEYGRTISK